MILQIVSVGSKRLISTKIKSNRMLIRRTRLNSLLDALTMGVFQNLQVTANDKRVMIIPRAVNTRMTIPPGLENFKLATGKSEHSVRATLDCFPAGHSVQLSEPGIGLIVPRGHDTHCQQQGEVMDFLVPAKHLSTHSDFGGPPVRVFQRIFSENCNRLSCSALSSHFPTTTSFNRFVFASCTCWILTIS